MSKSKYDKPQDDTVAQAESLIETSHQEGAINKTSESRRKFTKAGLLAPPVLMSLASRPVLGGGTPCISNILSGNLSNPLRGECVIGAGGPSYWLGLSQQWDTKTGGVIKSDTIDDGTGTYVYVADCGACLDDNSTPADPADDKKWGLCIKGTKLDEIFTTTNGKYVSTNKNSMFRILCFHKNNPAGPKAKIRAHFIAAYLNALDAEKAGAQYVLTPSQVIHLWNGDYGHVVDVVTFLQSTWSDNWQGNW